MGCSAQGWLGPWVWCLCSLARVPLPAAAHPARLLSTPHCPPLLLHILSLEVPSPVSLLLRGLQPNFTSFYDANLTRSVPSSGSAVAALRVTGSSPCHSRPALVDGSAIVSHWLLWQPALQSHGLTVCPLRRQCFPRSSFAHGSPPLQRPSLPLCGPSPPSPRPRGKGASHTGSTAWKPGLPALPPCLGSTLRRSTDNVSTERCEHASLPCETGREPGRQRPWLLYLQLSTVGLALEVFVPAAHRHTCLHSDVSQAQRRVSAAVILCHKPPHSQCL